MFQIFICLFKKKKSKIIIMIARLHEYFEKIFANRNNIRHVKKWGIGIGIYSWI